MRQSKDKEGNSSSQVRRQAESDPRPDFINALTGPVKSRDRIFDTVLSIFRSEARPPQKEYVNPKAANAVFPCPMNRSYCARTAQPPALCWSNLSCAPTPVAKSNCDMCRSL
jgi:hypothetical protein